ncbi:MULTISPECIES: type II toxin-antitoxin system VapC family toxin [unclassified Aureimonas]|uniref:type II toxin-antitoxin system VapC family toxin n=1 Tax=unclassified Aureimonas TaxID=2615206 RepID=UPI0006FFDDE3|nr:MULTISPECIES: type II toxin-antitoxin system VapC family toxin [unclassified Aureimonas]KQT53815.1 pilus assembly protein CpaF [Aureimonas sp. Leaf427]KQT71744.1 pilus assembly protein CpaF [Aureimonas sp. Leaf460]
MYLIDTMVLSELGKTQPHPGVVTWMDATRYLQAYVSVMTIGEIERGIHKIEQREGQPANRHRDWLKRSLLVYDQRILPVTIEVARRWGRLTDELRNTNPDLLIAATALEHDLTVVTRNTRHFEPTGAKLLNPYES